MKNLNYIENLSYLSETELKAVEILQETQSKKKTSEILNLSKEDLNRITKGMLDRLGCLSVRDIMAGRFGNKYGRRKSNG
jgi:hypothetical protein